VATRIICVLIAAPLVWSQERAASSQPRVAFDAVSVKPTPPNRDQLFDSYCAGGGRFTIRGTPLLSPIAWAYGVNKAQIDGVPGWLNSFGTYDIEAVAGRPISRDECRTMVQALFEERFKLRMHRETRTVPVFALTFAKNGPKFAAGDKVTINGAVKQVTTERGDPVGWTMARLANYLASDRFVQRPIVDRTTLSGTYGFTLNYSIVDGDGRPDIFAALPDQLGLRLQATKAPVEVWVVDHIERPSGN
jgi:uncharacterized protein (TIGR03435 family)